MIDRFQLLRNVGRFASFTGSDTTRLGPFCVIYAENGRGKTTIAAVLRSLQSGDPNPVQQRRRLGGHQPPHVVVRLADGTLRTFLNGAWSDRFANIVVFDDFFTDDNVFSGLQVTAANRQSMHQIILGREGVRLAQEMEAQTAAIADLTRQLRELETSLHRDDLAGLTVHQFCGISLDPNAAEALRDSERRLSALRDRSRIASAGEFATFAPPTVPVEELRGALKRSVDDLNTAAVAAIRAHLGRLGAGSEQWVREGRTFQHRSIEMCPYCAQSLSGSELVEHYGAYFGRAYAEHTTTISAVRQKIRERFGGDSLAGYTRTLEAQRAARTFWMGHLDVPAFEVNLEAFSEAWASVRDALLELVDRKLSAPLDSIEFDQRSLDALAAYDHEARHLRSLSQVLIAQNARIRELKAEISSGDITATEQDVVRLRRSVARSRDDNMARCNEWAQLTTERERLEQEKIASRTALDAHRATVFPRYEASINEYLRRFNAGFRIAQMQATNPRGIPSSEYFVEINRERVAVSGAAPADAPSFKSTLSAGDRSTLAFCFFLSSLPDLNLREMVVVIDDPLSSLDDYRTSMTTQEIRGIIDEAAQVIVLSHSKPLLCSLAAGVANPVALEVRRQGDASTIETWAVHAEAVTEYDQRAEIIREYVRQGANREAAKRVAQALRHQLEGYLRVAAPEHFPPGAMLGQFINRARQAENTGTPIARTEDVSELEELTHYANKFHHETNPAYDMAIANLNEQELEGFAKRVLEFTGL